MLSLCTHNQDLDPLHKMGTVSQSFLQYYLHRKFATPMVLTKGMPTAREICILLICHGSYVMFDVKKNSSFLKVVQSLKREPYLRKTFVIFLLL